MAKKSKDKKNSEAAKKRGQLSWKMRLFMIVLCLLGIVFLPTTLILMAGLLPSLVSLLTSTRNVGPRTSTVFAMNLAGVIPFVFKLWDGTNDFEASFEIISNLRYVSVMYLAAAFGYMIDWVVTGLMSSFLYQKGMNRMKSIKKRQDKLIEQWGVEVSGGLIGDSQDESPVTEPERAAPR